MGDQAQRQIIMNHTGLASIPSDHPGPFTDQLRLAAAACLSRFKGSSREHTESDLRCYLARRSSKPPSRTPGITGTRMPENYR
jgi:hypothetical protein